MTPEVVTDCSYKGHSVAELVLSSYWPSQVIVSFSSNEQLLIISRIVAFSGSNSQLPSSMIASGLN